MNPILHRFLRTMVRDGALTVIDAEGRSHTYGNGTGVAQVFRLHDKGVERALVMNPELALGETYMDGRWSLEGGALTELLGLLMRNFHSSSRSRFTQALRMAVRRLHQHNTRRAARRNAKSHYDVGNEIYRLFLDEDWQYSCAYFPHFDVSL